MSISHQLSIYRGDDVVLPFDIDEDLTAWTIAFILSEALDDTTPVLNKSASITNAAQGLCEVVLSETDTKALAEGTYYWELARTNAGSKAVLADGKLVARSRVLKTP
jgi:hypothetical protein